MIVKFVFCIFCWCRDFPGCQLAPTRGTDRDRHTHTHTLRSCPGLHESVDEKFWFFLSSFLCCRDFPETPAGAKPLWPWRKLWWETREMSSFVLWTKKAPPCRRLNGTLPLTGRLNACCAVLRRVALFCEHLERTPVADQIGCCRGEFLKMRYVNSCVHASATFAMALGAWVTRVCTRFQIPCLLRLKENQFPPPIGYSGRLRAPIKHWNMCQFFEIHNHPDAYLSKPTNLRLTHTTSAKERDRQRGWTTCLFTLSVCLTQTSCSISVCLCPVQLVLYESHRPSGTG